MVNPVVLSDGRVVYCKEYNITKDANGDISLVCTGTAGTDYSYPGAGNDPEPRPYPGALVDITRDGDGNYNIHCRSTTTTCFITYKPIPRTDIQNLILLNDGQGTNIYADNIGVTKDGDVYGATCLGNASTVKTGGGTWESIIKGGGLQYTCVKGIMTSTYDFGNATTKFLVEP